MLNLVTAAHVTALALLAGAAWTDVRTGHIPNCLTLLPLGLAPLVYLVLAGPVVALLSLVAALLCALVPYLMFRRGAAGGGDVKLLAAVGAVAGASFGIETQLFGFALAAVFSLVRLAYRGKLGHVLGNSLLLFVGAFLPRRYRRLPVSESMSTVRMGAFFLLGALLSLWIRSTGVA